MNRWCQESEVCSANLADVLSNDVGRPEFSESRWFKRGWTLQELIAPSTVIFLTKGCEEISNKLRLQPMISKVTGIPAGVLLGADLESANIAPKMSWASKRETTRVVMLLLEKGADISQ